MPDPMPDLTSTSSSGMGVAITPRTGGRILTSENPGVNPDSVITFPDPGSGVNVTQRYAKLLEKTLLLRFDKAHGGRSEWYKVSPIGGLTIQQLAARLSTLLTSFGTADLENNSNVFIRQFEDSMQNTA